MEGPGIHKGATASAVSKSTALSAGVPRCVAADFPSGQLKREQRGGRTRESSGNAGAGRLAAGSHVNSSARQEVSILAGVCVCLLP